jgi:23S rRNA pseudouridine2605 synthase
MESIKLQKYFTDCGVLSRRAAEREITLGHVTVNGTPAYLGQRIQPELDRVLWQGKMVKPLEDQKYYLLLHKPRGVLTTMSDDRGRPTVASLVANLGARVYPVGRLDMDSEGLLLMTNDGDFANAVMHPSTHIPKYYRVTLRSPMTDRLSMTRTLCARQCAAQRPLESLSCSMQ